MTSKYTDDAILEMVAKMQYDQDLNSSDELVFLIDWITELPHLVRYVLIGGLLGMVFMILYILGGGL